MKKALMFIAAILIFSLLFPATGCTSGASSPGAQDNNQQGNIVGSWEDGDSIITFNPDGTYIQSFQGMTSDTGSYSASDGQMTMASRGGQTSTGSYRVSGNTLTGFTDSYGEPTTYSRISSPAPPTQPMLQLAFAGNRNGKYALFLINADGSGEKQITNWSSEDYVHPSWHPEGEVLAVQRHSSRTPEGFLWGIAIIDLNGTRKDMINDINYHQSIGGPNFSPYGNLIVCDGFVTFNLGGVQGSIPVKLPTATPGRDFSGATNPNMSPEASMIAFDALFTRIVTPSPTVKPSGTPNPQLDGAGITSPDQIRGLQTDASAVAKVRRVCVVSFEGTNARQLTTSNEKYDDTYPAWSPDGNKIAFMSNRSGGKNQIYVMNADGSGQTQITNDTFENHDPAWSPDGAYIAYVSDHSGISELCIIRPDGSGRTRVNKVNESVKTPAWRPLPGQALGVPPTPLVPSTPPITTKPPAGTAPPATTSSTTGRLNISCSGTNSPYLIYVNGAQVGKDWANLNLAPGSYRVTIYNSKGTIVKDVNSVVIAGKDSIVKVSGAG